MTGEDGWPAWREIAGDEALCCIWDTIDGGGDIANRLAEVRASGHPEAEHVASSVEAFSDQVSDSPPGAQAINASIQ